MRELLHKLLKISIWGWKKSQKLVCQYLTRLKRGQKWWWKLDMILVISSIRWTVSEWIFSPWYSLKLATWFHYIDIQLVTLSKEKKWTRCTLCFPQMKHIHCRPRCMNILIQDEDVERWMLQVFWNEIPATLEDGEREKNCLTPKYERKSQHKIIEFMGDYNCNSTQITKNELVDR